jgi:3-deoxy-7-phosphoheptulonate synthase
VIPIYCVIHYNVGVSDQIHNVNIDALDSLISPYELKEEFPMTDEAHRTVVEGRTTLQRIMAGKDPRFLMIVGPCSIHDPNAALDYAQRLRGLRDQYRDRLYILMRVYFEKPRTTIGWKGLINDPDMDGTCDMTKGLKLSRQLLLKINELGIPVANEMLDPISPQYMSGLVSWASIGARTTESQTHREMASGLSMPVGFKNSTDGSVDVALSAMQAAQHPHSFIGIDQDGHTCIVRTKGNPWGHVILRGGHQAPNYHPENIKHAVTALQAKKLLDRVMVDCSHANSEKKQENQEIVLKSVIDQVVNGNTHILGAMIESNIYEGSQSIPKDLNLLKYGVSVTDACMGWDATATLIKEAWTMLSGVSRS